MPRSKHATLLALASGALALYTLLAAAVFSHIAIRERMDLRQSVDNMGWAGSHFQTEFYKFEQRLSAFAAGLSNVDLREVQLRYDILVGRMGILQAGAQRDVYGGDRELTEIYEQIRNNVLALEPEMVAIAAGDRSRIQPVLSVLGALEPPVAKLAGGISRFATAQRVALGASIVRSANWLGILLVGQVVTLVVLGAFLWRQVNDLRRAQGALESSNHALRASQADVRRNEYRFRQFFENMRDIIVCLGTKGQSAHGFGYDAAGVMLLGRDVDRIAGTRNAAGLAEVGKWYNAVHPDDRPAYAAAEQRRKEHDESYTITYRFTHPETGEQRWATETAWAAKDPASDAVYYDSYILDVTEHKKLELALRESEAEVRDARQQLVDGIEALTDGFALYDADDRLVVCNKRYRDRFETLPGLIRPGVRFEEVLRARVAAGRVTDAVGNEESWIAERIERHRNPRGVHESRFDDHWYRYNEQRTSQGGVVAIFTDIDELKERERQLRESQAILRIVIDNSPIAINVKDRDGRYVLMNRFLADVFATTPDAAIGKLTKDVYRSGYDNPRHQESHLQVVHSGEAILDSADIFAGVSGDESWISNKSPVKDSAGNVQYVVTVSVPVPQLAQANKELSDSRAMLLEAERGARLVSWHQPLNADTGTVWSENIAEILGVSAKDVASDSEFLDHVHPEDRVRFRELMAQMTANPGSYEVEYRFCRRDGRTIWVRGTAKVQYDNHGQPRRLIGTVQDITAPKAVEQALRDSESRLKDAQRRTKIAYWTWDSSSRKYILSDEAASILGLPSIDILQTDGALLELIDDRDRGRVEEAFARQLREPLHQVLEYRLRRPDGTLIWIRDIADVAVGPDGKTLELVGTLQDVTDQKQAEAAVRQSELHLRAAQRRARMAYWTWDVAAGESYEWSDEAASILGLPGGGVPPVDSEYVKLIHPDDRARIAREYDYTLEHYNEFEFSYRVLRSDGSIIWIRELAEPIRGADGRVVQMIGTIQDVTSQKRIEEALRESEARLRGFMDHAPMIIHLKDSEGRYQVVNKEFERIEGMELKRVQGLTVRDILPPEIAGPLWEQDREVLERGRVSVREHHDVARSEYSDMVAVKFPLRDADGKITGIGCCVQDTTERKRMERALRESEARLRGFMDHAPMLISLKDGDERYQLVNRELTEFLGKDAQAIVGRTVHDLFPRHIAEKLSEDDRTVLSTGAVISREFSETETYDRYAEVFVTKFPIRNDDGAIVGVGGITLDISERKRVEQALRESEARLRGFMHNAPVGMIIKSADQKFLMVNSFVTRAYNLPEAAFLGQRTSNLALSEGARIVEELEQMVIESGKSASREVHFPEHAANPWTHQLRFPIFDANGVMTSIGGFAIDITDRKKAEMAKEQSEALLRSFLENSPAGMAVKDLDGRFLMVNRHVEAEYGLRDKDILGRRSSEFATVEEAEVGESMDRQVLETGEAVEREIHLPSRQGFAWTYTVKFPIKDSGGRITAIGGFGFDIGERKRAELALRESEARLRSFMEFSPVGMMVKDLDQRVIMMNRRCAANLGREPAAVIGHRTTEFLSSGHAELVTAHERTVLEAGVPQEREFHFPGRREVEWTHEVKFPIRDTNGQTIALGGIVTDISERKRSEIALKESQLLWQSFMDNSPFGMSIKDLDRRFLSVNARAAETLRAPSSRILGRKTEEILPSAGANAVAALERMVIESGKSVTQEVHFPERFGATWTHEVKFPIRDAEGQVVGIGGIGIDISDRKQAESKLQASESRLKDAQRRAKLAYWAWDKPSDNYERSEEMAALLGIPEKEVPANEQAYLSFVHPDDRERVTGLYAGLVANPHDFAITYRACRRDGEVIWIREIGEAKRDTNGNAIGLVGTIQDVTSQTQAEAALRDSEALLKEAQRSAKLAYWNWEASLGRASNWSDNAADVLGIAPSPVPIEDEAFRELIHPEDRARAAEAHRRIYYELQPYDLEYRVHRADGTYGWIHETANVTAGDDGVPIRMVGTIQNVTERKRMESALRESESRLRDAIESMNDGFAIFDANDRFVMSNAKFLHEFNDRTADLYVPGREFEDILRNSFARGQIKDFIGREEEWLDERMRMHRRATGSIEQETHDGRRVLLTERRMRDGGIAALRTDITQLKATERALRDSEARLLDAQRRARLAYWYWHKEATEYEWSSEAARILGCSADRLPANQDDYMTLVHEDDRERLTVLYDHATIVPEPYEVDYRIVWPDGSVRWIRELAESDSDENGAPYRAVGTLQDVTDQKSSEEALRKNHRRLVRAQGQARITDWEWDIRLDVCTWSDGAAAVLRTTEDRLPRRLDEFFTDLPTEERSGALRTLRSAAESGVGYDIEFRAERENGNHIWLREIAEVERDSSGRPARLIGTIQDITSQKLNEEALRESESRLRSAQRRARLAYWTWDRATRTYEFSFEIAEILGIDPLTMPRTNDELLAFVDPADRSWLSSRIEQLHQQPADWAFEYRLHRPDGQVVWVRDIGEASWDGVNLPERISGTLQDITDLKRGEEALRESEARLRGFMDNVPFAMYIKDVDGRYLMQNREAERIEGKPVSEVLGKRPSEIYVPALAQRFEAEDRQIMATGQPLVTEYGDPTLPFYQESLTVKFPIRDAEGRVVAVGGVTQDVSDRRRAERALRESEARLRSFMDHAPFVAYLKDAESRFVLVNREFQRVEQMPESAFLGRTAYDLVPKDEADAWTDSDSVVLSKGDIVVRELSQFRLQEYSHTLNVKFPVRDSAGQIIGIGGFSQDITERKRVELALRDSQARLKKAQRIANLGSWDWTAGSEDLRWSEEALEIFGYTDGKIFRPKREWQDQIHPDDQPAVNAKLEAFRAGGRKLELTYRILLPDRSIRVIREDIERTTDSTGAAIAESGTVQDVTEWDRTQRALRESESMLRAAQHRARLGSWSWDKDSDIIHFSPELSEIFGVAPDKLPKIESEMLAFVDSLDRDWLKDLFNRIREQPQSHSVEYRIHRFDGATVWLRDIGDPVYDEHGKFTGFVGTIQDITPLKQSELALRESESRLRRAQQQVRLAYWTLQLETEEYQWAPGAGLILGVADSDLPQSEDGYFSVIHPDDRERMKRIYDKITQEQDDFNHEFRILRPDGVAIWVREIGEVEYDANGQRVSVAGTIQDITSQRSLEEQLRQAQKMEAIGQLTGGIAHDFNNLLAVVLGNLELVTEQIGDNKKLARGIDNAVKASLRGADLTQRLLAFARRQALAPVPTDVNELIRGMRDLITRPLGPKIEFSAVLGKNVWPIEIDQAQLESALLNMALNARDAMPGGGRLTIETDNTRVVEENGALTGDLHSGDYVLITVSDTGSGMSDDVKARAFDPFYTTKSMGKGTGLGLSMVYGFVKQSGGHIRIDSESGVGTSMRIYLPRAHDRAAVPEPESAAATPKSRGETIMVLEDEAEVATVAQRYLMNLGYKVILAEDAEMAMAKLTTTPRVDLLLADVILGGKRDGRAVAKEAVARWPHLKVMFMSGYAPNGVTTNGIEDMPDIHISKPFRKSELARQLRRVLDS